VFSKEEEWSTSPTIASSSLPTRPSLPFRNEEDDEEDEAADRYLGSLVEDELSASLLIIFD